MPPVPSVRGERIVLALERAGFKVARSPGATTSCVILAGAAPPCRFIPAATSPKEPCPGAAPPVQPRHSFCAPSEACPGQEHRGLRASARPILDVPWPNRVRRLPRQGGAHYVSLSVANAVEGCDACTD